MKNFFLFLALLPATLMAQERIMVIADPHVMAESLLNTKSPSYQEMLEGQPVEFALDRLTGINCKERGTSCSDQLTRVLRAVL